MYKYRMRALTPLLLSALLVPTIALGQDQEAIRQAQERLKREPPVSQVVEVAMRYFRVHPEVLDSLRTAAHRRAFLPLLAAGYRYDDDKFTRFEEQTITNPRQNDEDTMDRSNAMTIGAVWDLRELVFNPSEVQVFGLIGVQRDIMLEATRTYYLRKQLLLRKIYRPPEDPMAAQALDMRIEEFTTLLDVLTGGWFTENTQSVASREG